MYQANIPTQSVYKPCFSGYSLWENKPTAFALAKIDKEFKGPERMLQGNGTNILRENSEIEAKDREKW